MRTRGDKDKIAQKRLPKVEFKGNIAVNITTTKFIGNMGGALSVTSARAHG
jgi:hypothetical protein